MTALNITLYCLCWHTCHYVAENSVKRKDWKGTALAFGTNVHLRHSHQVADRYLIQMRRPDKWQLMDEPLCTVSVLWTAPTYLPQQKHFISEISKLSVLTLFMISHRIRHNVQKVSNTPILPFPATKLSSIVCPHCLTKTSHVHRQTQSAPRARMTGCSGWRISTPVLITFQQFQTQ